MRVSLAAPVRRMRAAWARAQLVLGTLSRLVAPLAALSILAGLFEAGVLAVTAQVAFAMAQDDASTDAALGPWSMEATVPLLLGIALVLAMLRLVIQWLLARLTARMHASSLSQLRRRLFQAYSDAAWSVQSRDGEGQLQEMMTSHAMSAARVAMTTASVVSPLAAFVILVGSALLLSPAIALAVAIAAVGIFLLLRPLGRRTRRHAVMHSDSSVSLARGIDEAVRLSEEMHVYGTAPQHRVRVDRLIDEVEGPYFRAQFLGVLVPGLFQGLALLLVIVGLAVLYALGGENLGALGAIVLLLVRALSYGQQMQTAYQKLNDEAPFLDRLLKDVDRYADSAPKSGNQPVPARSDLAFDRVSFSYNSGQRVLHEVSFHVEAGETIGIVGLSGAGKSTLVQLLLRLREPESGVYRINSVDVRHISLEDWHGKVTYVSQEPRLLGGTVTENIQYLREDIGREAVETAARMAHIHDEIMSWSGGYDHRVGQRLDAVSGGQRQRLCLARALAGKPEILVLDEPTSALDQHSETAIQRSLEELRGSMIMFIVAHRMSTLRTCDRIMVLEAGRIAAFDTPANLQRINGYYRSAMELAGAGPQHSDS
jgi:ATP-binding cassette, subfamily B, bacterial